MLRNKLIFWGALIISLLWIGSLVAPFFWRADPNQIHLSSRLIPPCLGHPLGTDQLGRDLFSRMLYGGRISLYIGFIAVGISVVIGIILGSIAGYYGGVIDWLIMRLTDIMLCFPIFFLILAVVAILEPSMLNIMIVIGCTSWMSIARLIRAEILSLKTREFIQASRLCGASDFWIITRHLIPNAVDPVLVSAVLGFASAVLLEAGLSFLGLGVQPPIASWGNILCDSRSVLASGWWMMLFPGLAIFTAVMGYNLLGEGMMREFRQSGE